MRVRETGVIVQLDGMLVSTIDQSRLPTIKQNGGVGYQPVKTASGLPTIQKYYKRLNLLSCTSTKYTVLLVVWSSRDKYHIISHENGYT